VFFESQASNLQPNPVTAGGYYDKNGVQDVFFWNFVSGNTSLESRDSNNAIVGLPSRVDPLSSQRVTGPTAAPFLNPVTSYYGNYVLFETSNPLVDLDVAGAAFPDLLGNNLKAGDMAQSDGALHQVYLRYIGPR
jgi:hypothetical protein